MLSENHCTVVIKLLPPPPCHLWNTIESFLTISDNFYEQDNTVAGCVCVFSLKNPSYPEYLCTAR